MFPVEAVSSLVLCSLTDLKRGALGSDPTAYDGLIK
jgi:hypothetical protein